MVKRASIEFVEESSPVRGLVTKFGGQPTWLSAPQWPLSRETGEPMRFIAQVALDRDLFGDIPGRMAYLFITDNDEEHIDRTWEPDGGENALIIQPGEALVPVDALAEGPTLYRMVARPGRKLLVKEPCEFSVGLSLSEDPEFVAEEEHWQRDDEANHKYSDSLTGNKIGGTPGFLQGDEFPGEEFRQLLVQLDSTCVPFSINFGDAGIGYAFLATDGRSGKFLFQSCC